MVDRRVRYSNPNGKFPAPGGGPQLLEEFKAPALIDFQSERLPAMRPVAAENTPVVAAVKSVPVADVKRSRSNEQAAPESSPEPATWNPEQRETPRLEQAEPQNRPYFSESDGRKGIAGHPGTVLTFEKV